MINVLIDGRIIIEEGIHSQYLLKLCRLAQADKVRLIIPKYYRNIYIESVNRTCLQGMSESINGITKATLNFPDINEYIKSRSGTASATVALKNKLQETIRTQFDQWLKINKVEEVDVPDQICSDLVRNYLDNLGGVGNSLSRDVIETNILDHLVGQYAKDTQQNNEKLYIVSKLYLSKYERQLPRGVECVGDFSALRRSYELLTLFDETETVSRFQDELVDVLFNRCPSGVSISQRNKTCLSTYLLKKLYSDKNMISVVDANIQNIFGIPVIDLDVNFDGRMLESFFEQEQVFWFNDTECLIDVRFVFTALVSYWAKYDDYFTSGISNDLERGVIAGEVRGAYIQLSERRYIHSDLRLNFNVEGIEDREQAKQLVDSLLVGDSERLHAYIKSFVIGDWQGGQEKLVAKRRRRRR